MKINLFSASMALLILPASLLVAQTDDSASMLDQLEETSTGATVSTKGEVADPMANDELIDVDFPNQDIRSILRGVAELKKLNVVIPDSIAGRMSIKLNQVSWQQVFQVVLEPIGYTYVVDGNIIKIRSLKDLMLEPLQTNVYIVNYAKAAELSTAVTPLVDTTVGGRTIVDTRTNSIVVTERNSRLRQIEDIINRLDRPTEQVMIESKFIEVTDSDAKDLGIDWTSLQGLTASGSYEKEGVTTYDRSKMIDTSADITSWTELDDNFLNTETAVLSVDTFSLVLNALESNSKVELVSNPTIVTMNNIAATINIGEEYPIPNYQYNEEQGTYEINGFEYKHIGIQLDVTPQVNNNGMINLKLDPEITSQTGTVTFGGSDGASIPIISQRKASSTVTLKSGYTLAIGGLIESTTTTEEEKVPVLGSIPVLGRLFRNNYDSVDRRNLVIFITAKTLDPNGSTYKEVIPAKIMTDMQISESDLPGYKPTAEESDVYAKLQDQINRKEQSENEGKARLQLQEMQEAEAEAAAKEAEAEAKK